MPVLVLYSPSDIPRPPSGEHGQREPSGAPRPGSPARAHTARERPPDPPMVVAQVGEILAERASPLDLFVVVFGGAGAGWAESQPRGAAIQRLPG